MIEITDLNGMTQGQGLPDAFLMARDYIGNALFDVPDNSFPKATSPASISPKDGKKYSFVKDKGKAKSSEVAESVGLSQQRVKQ